jgi:hypothetical protein
MAPFLLILITYIFFKFKGLYTLERMDGWGKGLDNFARRLPYVRLFCFLNLRSFFRQILPSI